MRAAMALLALPASFILVACHREPDFDERYENANAQITRTADEIEAQISATGQPASDATAAVR